MATRYIEDVHEGEQIPAYTVKAGYMELNRFASANEEFIPIHMDPDYAKNVAKLPDVIIMGNLKLAYLANALERWAGEDGWIKKIDVSYRKMDNVNEEVTATGVVKGKRVEDGEHLVDIDIWIENSKGEKTTPGSAVVSLPSKG